MIDIQTRNMGIAELQINHPEVILVRACHASQAGREETYSINSVRYDLHNQVRLSTWYIEWGQEEYSNETLFS